MVLDAHLGSFDIRDPALLAAAVQLADIEAQQASRRRVQAWKATMQDDVVKLGKWVQRTPPQPQVAEDLSSSPHPESLAGKEAAFWKEWWNPASLPDLQQVRDICGLLGPSATVANEDCLSFSGSDLLDVAKKARAKASGIDGWTADNLSLLPSPFWNVVADLWTVCCNKGVVPVGWKHVRIALMPKSSGGVRPLAVASVLWRICMSASLRKLRPWIKSWADSDLFGGLPAKGIGDVHDLLHFEIADAKRRNQTVVGCKADIQKCFDSVCVAAALEVWKWLGAPSQLVNVISAFYSGQLRWFSWHGFFHPEPVSASRGLLQGCPTSPALLNGLMTLWLRYVKTQVPQIRSAIFLDDRTLWSVGAKAITVVTNAMEAGSFIDSCLGWQLHPHKTSCFTTKKSMLAGLQQVESVLGSPSSTFTLLGIHYNLFRQGMCVDAASLTQVIRERTRKIRLAARSLFARRILLRQLVVSLFAWTGSWHRYTKAVLNHWSMLIETAVWGKQPASGRSRFLFWNSLGTPEIHPLFALQFSTIKAEWRRQCRLKCGEPVVGKRGPRVDSVLQAWNWSISADGIWTTPEGSCPVGWCSSKHFVKIAKQAWLRNLWNEDSKTSVQLGDFTPLLHFRQHAVGELDTYERRVVTGAAVDARLLGRLGPPLPCHCGEEVPSREHLTFYCPSHRWSLPLRTLDERRLLVALVPQAPFNLFASACADAGLVDCIYNSSSPIPVLAIDGSCLQAPPGRDFWQRASWGIASSDGATFCGLVLGVEQTPHAGERTALLHACLAAKAANKPILILCDNEAVYLRFSRGIASDYWAGDLSPFWHLIRNLVVPGSSIFWVPSHGKRASWQPPPGLSAAACRELNARADEAAVSVTGHFKDAFDATLAKHSEAVAWSIHAFHCQVANTKRFWNALLDLRA